MTRKDFVLIAKALNAACPRLAAPWTDPEQVAPDPEIFDAWVDGAMAAWKDAVRLAANALSTTNPNFNRSRFIDACTPAGVAF